MSYDNYHAPNTSDSTIMPLILSIVVHGVVLAFLVFWQAPAPPPAPVGIEASFVGLSDIEAIEGQIRENARLAEKGDEGTDDKTSDKPTAEPPINAISEELAQKQAEFEKQMAAFAAELDKQALMEQQALIDKLKAEAEQEKAELAEAREAFANRDEKVKENQKGLDEARQARDKANEEAESKRKQGGISGSLDSGEKTNQESAGTAAKTTQGASGGVNKNSIITALQEIIYRNWQVPSNASGERLQATIRVDGSGNVLSVSVSGGSAALKESLERAIANSSPLSPVAGTEFRELKVSFVAK